MISFKQYLIESNADVDNEIKNKLADEAESKLKNSDEWNSLSQSERDAAIKEARKKAKSDYDNLSEEEKNKKREEHSNTNTKKEPTDEEIDKEIKKKLADNAEKTAREDDFWSNKTPAEQEQAIKDARKKAEDDYDKLSDEDKKKKRDEHEEALKKQQSTGTKEPTDEEIDKEIKKKLADDAEEEVKKQEGFSEESPEYQEKAIKDAREKAESDYDNLSDEDKKKKRDEHKATNTTTLAKTGEDKTGEDKTGEDKTGEDKENDKKIKELKNLLKKEKGELTPNEEKRLKELKKDKTLDKSDLTNDEIDKVLSNNTSSNFLNKLKEIDSTLSGDGKDGVYNIVKSMAPDVIGVFALCCPLGALAIAGTISVGLLTAMTVKACAKKKLLKPAKDVVDAAKDAANGDEKILKELDAVEKSAFVSENELATEEDFELNLEKNGLKSFFKFFKKNNDVLDKEVNLDKLTKATGDPEPKEKTEDELKQELKDKYKDADNVPDNLKGEDGKLDPAKVDALSGDDLKNATKEAGIEPTKKPEPKGDPEPKEKTEDELKQELKDKYKDADNVPDNLKGEDGKLDPAKVDALSGDDLKNTSKEAGIEPTKKPEPKGDPEPKELSNEDIEKMQDDMANLDPEKDKDKIKEMEDKLKDAAKKAGKDESEYLMKTDTDKDGKQRQHKTGPRGGKYYRVKGDDGWGDWISGEPNECLSSSIKNNINESCNKNSLKKYLYSKL